MARNESLLAIEVLSKSKTKAHSNLGCFKPRKPRIFDNRLRSLDNLLPCASEPRKAKTSDGSTRSVAFSGPAVKVDQNLGAALSLVLE